MGIYIEIFSPQIYLTFCFLRNFAELMTSRLKPNEEKTQRFFNYFIKFFLINKNICKNALD